MIREKMRISKDQIPYSGPDAALWAFSEKLIPSHRNGGLRFHSKSLVFLCGLCVLIAYGAAGGG